MRAELSSETLFKVTKLHGGADNHHTVIMMRPLVSVSDKLNIMGSKIKLSKYREDS